MHQYKVKNLRSQLGNDLRKHIFSHITENMFGRKNQIPSVPATVTNRSPGTNLMPTIAAPASPPTLTAVTDELTKSATTSQPSQPNIMNTMGSSGLPMTGFSNSFMPSPNFMIPQNPFQFNNSLLTQSSMLPNWWLSNSMLTNSLLAANNPYLASQLMSKLLNTDELSADLSSNIFLTNPFLSLNSFYKQPSWLNPYGMFNRNVVSLMDQLKLSESNRNLQKQTTPVANQLPKKIDNEDNDNDGDDDDDNRQNRIETNNRSNQNNRSQQRMKTNNKVDDESLTQLNDNKGIKILDRKSILQEKVKINWFCLEQVSNSFAGTGTWLV